jgi:DnaJ-class molecular chaperone
MADDEKCNTCNGRGQIWVQVVSPKTEPGHWETCPVCNGSGTR